MVSLTTPVCNFGWKAKTFKLVSTNNALISLEDAMGPNGLLVMFICNHCPYVKAIIKELSSTALSLKKYNVNSVAIMSNDTVNYPDDSFDNMKKFAQENHFSFPYLFDETQEIAKKYGAVCTPDFFGYNSNHELQYRGRLREMKDLDPVDRGKNELMEAMIEISQSKNGPKNQYPSMGCNIKWK